MRRGEERGYLWLSHAPAAHFWSLIPGRPWLLLLLLMLLPPPAYSCHVRVYVAYPLPRVKLTMGKDVMG